MRFIVNIPDDGLDITGEEAAALIQSALLERGHTLPNGDTVYFAAAGVHLDDAHDNLIPSRSFKTWLRRQEKRDDHIGDLARDAKGDTGVPAGRASLAAWRTHLRARGASDGAMHALDDAWHLFETSSE